MYEFKVLIVDDEVHAIEMITRLLEQIDGISLDLYTARNVPEALNILELGRMDMVITDIEMPGQSGLELVSCIRSRWKRCRVVILTAFSQFQYAYSALQMRASGYILKTESDEEIRSKLYQVLMDVESDMRESAHYAEKKMQHVQAVPKSDLMNLLKTSSDLNHQAEMLRQMSFSPHSPHLFLLMCRTAHGQPCSINETVLHELLGHYIRDSVTCMELIRESDSSFLWLLELTPVSGGADAQRISGTLEMVQNACINAFDLPLCFVFSTCRCESTLLSDTYRAVSTVFSQMGSPHQPYIYHLCDASQSVPELQDIPEVTLNWLRKYIDDHISSDLSLVNLAALTGYNPQYLSSLFRQKLNTTLSRYIVDKRMDVAQRMLADVHIPIQDIASHLGFASHSYFSRFIRRETGLTPQQLRAQLAEKT